MTGHLTFMKKSHLIYHWMACYIHDNDLAICSYLKNWIDIKVWFLPFKDIANAVKVLAMSPAEPTLEPLFDSVCSVCDEYGLKVYLW